MVTENADMIWERNAQYSMTKCSDMSFFPLLFTMMGLFIHQWQNVITTFQFNFKVNNSSDCEYDLNKLILDSLGVRNGMPNNTISAGGSLLQVCSVILWLFDLREQNQEISGF